MTVPFDQQRLIINGKTIKDHDRLIDHHITHGDIVTLILRLRGGMYLPPSSRNGWESIVLDSAVQSPDDPQGYVEIPLQ